MPVGSGAVLGRNRQRLTLGTNTRPNTYLAIWCGLNLGKP